MRYPKEPLTVKASKQNIEKLYEAIKLGTPLPIALTYARISKSEYEFCRQIEEQVRKAEESELFNGNISEETIRQRCDENGIDFQLVMNIRGKKTYAEACVEFIEGIEQAKAESVVRNLERLTVKEKFSNWQASAWLLERRYPDEFGKKEEQSDDVKVEPMRVEFIDPKSQQDRLEAMEKEINDETAS